MFMRIFVIALMQVLAAKGVSAGEVGMEAGLETLIRDSVGRAYGLRQQKLQTEKTENARLNAWSALLPTVGMRAGKSWLRTGSLDDAGALVNTDSNSASLSVSAEWTIWNNYANIRDVRLSSIDMQARTIDADLELQSHVVEVLDQYYGLQNLYVQRAATAEALKNAQSFADEAAELVRLGGKTKLDQMDTEIQVRNFENDARELENTIAIAERNFGILLNAPDRVRVAPIDVSKNPPYLMSRFEKELPAIRKLSHDQLATGSPELRSSVLRVERAAQEYSQRRLSYLPTTTFALSQGYDLNGYVRENASGLERRAIPSSSATLSVSWTVWDWLTTHRQITDTWRDLQSSRIDLEKKSRQVLSDFDSQLEQYDILVKSIDNARLILEQAEKQMEYTLAMYQLGRITLLQAQTASERLTNARNSLATRLRTQYVAAAKLLRQVGVSLLPDGAASPLLMQERPSLPSP
jgi:outer membrane protein TolC